MTQLSLKELQNLTGFYGSTSQVEELLQTVNTVAPTDLSVLIIGESGTGKEVIANAIHTLSSRKNRPLVSVNCGAIPEGILESELFGHEKGSFTGAVGQKKGYFEAADRGTIFLDEIGEMPLNTQVKLLRVLESSEFMRVGGTELQKVNVRIIAATNRNLERAVNDNLFRRDLFFRLKAITLEIPPLRKRKEDIQELVAIFARQYAEKNEINFKGFSPDAVASLLKHNWPGNVRELKNFVETAIILNKGEVVRSDFVRSSLSVSDTISQSDYLPMPINKTPEQAERELIYRMLMALKLDMDELKQILHSVLNNGELESQHGVHINTGSVEGHGDNEIKPTTISGMEREMIKDTLNKYAGSRRKTARALQISERTLYRKLKEYGL